MNTYNCDVESGSEREGQANGKQERPPRRSFIFRAVAVLVLLDYLWNDDLFSYRYLRHLAAETLNCAEQYSDILHTGPQYGVWQELYPGGSVDYFHDLRLEDRINPPSTSIAFVFTFLECPDRPQGQKPDVPEDSVENTVFYDEVSMLKMSVCTECQKILIGNSLYNATLYALVAGDAIDCVGPDGETFDRIKILEDLQFYVKIVGSPVGIEQINSTTNQYLKDNVEHDVGLKDLIKLQVFNPDVINHDIALLMDYDTYLMGSIDDLIIDLQESNSTASFMWREDAHEMGVQTGLLAVKPNNETFQDILTTYTQDTFDSATGWPSVVGGFPGAMGTSGILGHYYKTAGSAKILDQCIYGNNAAGDCADTPFEDIKVARLEKEVCGKPYDCPDLSNLPEDSLCHKFEEHWFANRETFETDLFHGGPKINKNGDFNKNTTKGYCKKSGRDGYEMMLNPFAQDISEIKPKPRKKADGGNTECTITCSQGQYVTPECTCSTDECDACPKGTRCQRANNGEPPLCIDCECGFCDYYGNACCNFNGVNNCKAATPARECKLHFGFFPGWPGTGNACSGVEISATAVPNGCGCQPSELTPCTYVPADKGADKCFIVRASEILFDTSVHPNFDIPSSPEAIDTATSCRNCLAACNDCIEGDGQQDTWAMQNCLGNEIGKKKESCRSNCAPLCKHSTVA